VVGRGSPEPPHDFVFAEGDKANAETVMAEYFKRVVAAPDSARGRAQSGYTIVNALAAVLAAGAVLAKLPEQNVAVKVAVTVAAAAWLVSMILFLLAVTYTRGSKLATEDLSASDTQPAGTDDQLLADAGDRVRNLQLERDSISKRVTAANVLASLGSATAISAILIQAFAPTPKYQIRLRLDQPVAAVSLACGKPVTELNGRVDLTKVNDPFMTVSQPAECPGVDRLSIKRDLVIAFSVKEG